MPFYKSLNNKCNDEQSSPARVKRRKDGRVAEARARLKLKQASFITMVSAFSLIRKDFDEHKLCLQYTCRCACLNFVFFTLGETKVNNAT